MYKVLRLLTMCIVLGVLTIWKVQTMVTMFGVLVVLAMIKSIKHDMKLLLCVSFLLQG